MCIRDSSASAASAARRALPDLAGRPSPRLRTASSVSSRRCTCAGSACPSWACWAAIPRQIAAQTAGG
eukprot:9316344-Alexandrium_andersonii.AAC.1